MIATSGLTPTTASPIVAARADRARDMHAVTVLVVGDRPLIHEVAHRHEPAREVRMTRLDAGLDHGDYLWSLPRVIAHASGASTSASAAFASPRRSGEAVARGELQAPVRGGVENLRARLEAGGRQRQRDEQASEDGPSKRRHG
jgi:hypothetical protein